MAETHLFSPEIQQLLYLLKRSPFQQKDIFLRDLLSNASDALDLVHYNALVAKLDKDLPLRIRVIPDEESNSLVVWDSGVGMRKADLVQRLNQVHRLGTRQMISDLQGQGPSSLQLIGLLSVGFFTSFLVADKVTVVTKHSQDRQYLWQSSGNDTFTVQEDAEGPPIVRGTQIILHLKPDCREFLNPARLDDVIRLHSCVIEYPVYLFVPAGVRTFGLEEMERLNYTPEITADGQFIRVNLDRPLWHQTPETVTEEEYERFYRHLTKDWEPPLAYCHFFCEGDVDFTAFLFVPHHDEFMLTQEFEQPPGTENMKVYIRGVYITQQVDQCLPHYLSFIRGAIFAEDPPLDQLDKETLAHLPRHVRPKIMSKCFEMLHELMKDETTALKFFGAFASYLKRGMNEDPELISELADLLLFHTNQSGSAMISLSNYLQKKPRNQSEVLFVTGCKPADCETTLKQFSLPADFEVLFVVDPFDESTVMRLNAVLPLPIRCLNTHLSPKGRQALFDIKQPLQREFQFHARTSAEMIA